MEGLPGMGTFDISSLKGVRRQQYLCALKEKNLTHDHTLGVSNLRPTGRMQPRMAVNVTQPKIINLLKTL